MPLSSLADAPSLTRPHTANSSLTDRVSRGLSQGRLNRGRIRSRASIDAMSVEDVENRPITAPNLDSKDTKLEIGVLELIDSDFESPTSSPTVKMGRRKVQKKSRRREESLAAILGDQILEADLKQESPSTRVDHNKRELALELGKDDAERPLVLTSQTSPPCVKRVENKAMHEAPDKDDEWGATDVLSMLPDGPETFLETEVKKMTTQSSINDDSAQMKPSSSKKADVDMSSDFGDYQPSFLSAPRRTPQAGRRRRPAGGLSQNIQRHLEPAVKTTYIKLSRKPESPDIVPQTEKFAENSQETFASSKLNKVSANVKVEEGPVLSRIDYIPTNTARDRILECEMASIEIRTDFPDGTGAFKSGLEFDRTPVSQDLSISDAGLANRKESPRRIDHVSPPSERDTSVGLQPALDHQDQFRQLSLDNYTEKTSKNNTPRCGTNYTEKTSNNNTPRRPDLRHDPREDLSPALNIQGFQNTVELERPAQSRKDEEEWSSIQKAFCDVLLAERNALQLKLDTERETFTKEKETFQVMLNNEGLRLQREIQLVSSAKEKVELERDGLANEVTNLREENLHLKDEILRVENERFAFEKKIIETEHSHEDFLLNKVEEEKNEAQKLAIQLTSEVQLLKNSSLLAEEKMVYLCKLHEQEVERMKSLHTQDLEVKDKHFDIERKFWSDHKTTMDTVTRLLDKGDEWAVKVDELHSALQRERSIVSSDKTAWMGTMNETVNKAQAALREWGDHCNGIKNQFDQLLAVLESGGREIRTMHLEERERLDKEHGHLKRLQEALQEERTQSLADLSASRERLEEMRSQCFFEKENFLTNCMQELKNIATEKEAVVHMREQLMHAEAALQKQIMEHAVTMQAEASEAAKQRHELERAKEMATEIVQEVEDARQELEHQRQAFEREIASAREFGLQAQQKVEAAMEIKREALQLKLDADAIQQESSREASEIERQKIQTAMAQKELLELKRRHDEERMRLAMERQQLCSDRKENGMSRLLREPMASEGPIYTIYDNLSPWDAMQRMKHTRKVSVVPTRSSQISSNSTSTFGSGPWVVESVEASLCLQAQEDFLAEASKVLQHTTQSTCKLLTKT